jgi:hypothetical protein
MAPRGLATTAGIMLSRKADRGVWRLDDHEYPSQFGSHLGASFIRACVQLSRIIAAAICSPARKFLASLS